MNNRLNKISWEAYLINIVCLVFVVVLSVRCAPTREHKEYTKNHEGHNVLIVLLL
jgi:hypothetical protein